MTTHFLYKCRKCGKIDDSTCLGGGNKTIAIIHLCNVIMGTVHETQAPRMLSIHSCENGSGISDLIGFEVTED